MVPGWQRGRSLRGSVGGCGDGAVGDSAMAVGMRPRWWGQAWCVPSQVAMGTEPWLSLRAQRWGHSEGPGQRWHRCSHRSRMASGRGGSGCLSPGCAGAGGADSGGADLLRPAGWGVGLRRRPSCPALRSPARGVPAPGVHGGESTFRGCGAEPLARPPRAPFGVGTVVSHHAGTKSPSRCGGCWR